MRFFFFFFFCIPPSSSLRGLEYLSASCTSVNEATDAGWKTPPPICRRKNIVKQMCVNRFATIAAKARKRVESAAKIQALFRMNHARLILIRWRRGVLMAQKLYRARQARKIVEKWRALAIAEAKRKAEEAKRLEEVSCLHLSIPIGSRYSSANRPGCGGGAHTYRNWD